jgi:hypothetical protein
MKPTSRFQVLEDGTIVARAGTQNNCAGIAQIHVKIIATSDGCITFGLEFDPTWPGEPFGVDVPGCAIPEEYRQAIFHGATAAFDQYNAGVGVHYEIISAWIHLVDARENKFYEAGFHSLKGWLDIYSSAMKKAEANELA